CRAVLLIRFPHRDDLSSLLHACPGPTGAVGTFRPPLAAQVAKLELRRSLVAQTLSRPVCHCKSAQSALVSRSYTRLTEKCTLGGEVFNMCFNFELFTKRERVAFGHLRRIKHCPDVEKA